MEEFRKRIQVRVDVGEAGRLELYRADAEVATAMKGYAGLLEEMGQGEQAKLLYGQAKRIYEKRVVANAGE